jgi:hypothetical protein
MPAPLQAMPAPMLPTSLPGDGVMGLGGCRMQAQCVATSTAYDAWLLVSCSGQLLNAADNFTKN